MIIRSYSIRRLRVYFWVLLLHRLAIGLMLRVSRFRVQELSILMLVRWSVTPNHEVVVAVRKQCLSFNLNGGCELMLVLFDDRGVRCDVAVGPGIPTCAIVSERWVNRFRWWVYWWFAWVLTVISNQLLLRNHGFEIANLAGNSPFMWYPCGRGITHVQGIHSLGFIRCTLDSLV